MCICIYVCVNLSICVNKSKKDATLKYNVSISSVCMYICMYVCIYGSMYTYTR